MHPEKPGECRLVFKFRLVADLDLHDMRPDHSLDHLLVEAPSARNNSLADIYFFGDVRAASGNRGQREQNRQGSNSHFLDGRMNPDGAHLRQLAAATAVASITDGDSCAATGPAVLRRGPST